MTAVPTTTAKPTSTPRFRRGASGLLAATLLLTGLGFANASPAEARSRSRDFSAVAVPNALTLSAGQSAGIRIRVARGSRFRSALRYQIDNPFVGVNATAVGSSASSIDINVTSAPTAPTQSGEIRVIVTGGGRTRVAAIAVQVQGAAPKPVPTNPPPPPPPVTAPPTTLPAVVGDFALAIDPSQFTINTGASTTIGVFVNPASGYNGSPKFDVIGTPTGVVANFVNPTSKTGTNLVITVSSSAPRGAYPLTIRAIDGDRIRTASTVMTIQALGDFSLAASFDPNRAVPGSTATLKVVLGPPAGSTQIPDVELSLTGFPPGTNVSPAVIKTNTNQTFTLTLPTGLAEGTYLINVRGVSGTVIRSLTASLIVSAKPNVTITPASQSIPVGGQASFEIVYVPVPGIGTPALTVVPPPAGVSLPAGLQPYIVYTSDGRRFLAVNTTSATPKGTYTITVAATSGAAVTNVSVQLAVT
jgi:hypothetical protein